jgi:hypothetical protein
MLKIVQKPVDKLIPYVNNSRTHSDEQIAQIASSIKEFGWTNPILIDGENGIIAGHGRLMAARKLGYKEVPTIELKDLTETQRKAYIIADNRLALNAGWDNEMLTFELNVLLADGFALEMLGFDPKELDALLEPEVLEGLTDEDAVPDVPDEPTTKLGDIYQLGNHRLMCGDSTSIDAVTKLTSGGGVDMLLTDPPYNISENGAKPVWIDSKTNNFCCIFFRCNFYSINFNTNFIQIIIFKIIVFTSSNRIWHRNR